MSVEKVYNLVHRQFPDPNINSWVWTEDRWRECWLDGDQWKFLDGCEPFAIDMYEAPRWSLRPSISLSSANGRPNTKTSNKPRIPGVVLDRISKSTMCKVYRDLVEATTRQDSYREVGPTHYWERDHLVRALDNLVSGLGEYNAQEWIYEYYDESED